MIRIIENNMDLLNYNRLREQLFLEVCKNIQNITPEESESFKLISKNSPSKCVYCIIRDIITYDDKISHLVNEYKVNTYLELAYYYEGALEAKANLNLRKQYLSDLKNYIVSNSEAQTFIPDYSLINDLGSLSQSISNQKKYVEFIKEELFKSFLDFNQVCSKIFDYDKYINGIRNKIVESTKIEVCPYCNKGLIYEIRDHISNDLRFLGDLDHFYLQSKMPLLGLTFSNFIPSCISCNRSLKHQSLENILNPRKRGFDSDARFVLKDSTALLTNNINAIEITLEIRDSSTVFEKIKASKDLFEIDQLYNHISTKEELKRLFNATRILSKSRRELWKGIFEVETFEEAYELLIGFDCDTTDFLNIRHGKLISDIFSKDFFR